MKQTAPVIVTIVAIGCLALAGHADAPVEDVKPVTTCFDDQVRDQDDMCIWRHPTDAAKSVIITADKYAHRLFVYDLDGKTLQIVPTFKPGNIDIRSGFPLGDKKVDLVVFCERRPGAFKLRAYTVDPETRKITQIDNDAINTGQNYGGTMYHSPVTGKFYFFTTAKHGGVQQVELFDDGKGKVGGKIVRKFPLGFCEGAVADDQARVVFISDERRGVWRYPAEPDTEAKGKLVIKAGANGLRPDVEGITLYPTGEKTGYLIVSSQGNSTFKVYDRTPPHAFVATFHPMYANETDGIDAAAGNFGPKFPEGIFAYHTGPDRRRCRVMLASWKEIAKRFSKAGTGDK